MSGDDLFVANLYGNAVAELSASSGHLVRVISGWAYRFNEPDALAVSGNDIFVADGAGNSVTEFAV